MGFADFAQRRVRRATRKALMELGRRAVADIRQSINVPVSRIRGPRGGVVIIRSDPGEPPRREFKKLWWSIRYRVQPKTTGLADLIIYTKRKAAFFLEFGTDYMEPRPFWNPAKKRLRKYSSRLFKSLFEEYWRDDSFHNPDPQVDEALPESDM